MKRTYDKYLEMVLNQRESEMTHCLGLSGSNVLGVHALVESSHRFEEKAPHHKWGCFKDVSMYDDHNAHTIFILLLDSPAIIILHRMPHRLFIYLL